MGYNPALSGPLARTKLMDLEVGILSTAPSGGVASSSASVLRAAVLRHPTLACDLCSIYGQDFDCLGYRFPEKCAEPACLARLPPPLARSVRQAQQAGMLEQTPQA